MSASYRAIAWNRHKRLCDIALAGILVAAIGAFAGTAAATRPGMTAETLVIRSTAIAALALLHVILCIGPLCRLNSLFLPLHYNRRHLGVTMFFLALVHSAFAIIQFQGFGDANPIVGALTAYARDYAPGVGIANFPFEIFGAAALAILFVMAATSHDFWLKNLGASFWKAMHQLVHVAYGCLLVHVFFGALQSERSVAYPLVLGAGFAAVAVLHVAAWRKEKLADDRMAPAPDGGFVDACAAADLRESCGKSVWIGGERVALFRKGDRVFALSNVCRHQGGPLGEGRIVDGCATCPWHGWNYKVEDGCSPPPFKETLPTYNVRVRDGRVLVHPAPNPPGTTCAGASCKEGAP